jgi:hypothetical protein
MSSVPCTLLQCWNAPGFAAANDESAGYQNEIDSVASNGDGASTSGSAPAGETTAAFLAASIEPTGHGSMGSSTAPAFASSMDHR